MDRGEDLRRVLLVEDDEDDVLLVADLLEPWPDVRLETTSTIRGAATLLAAGDADCVLLDLNLPDAAGLDGLRTLLRAAPDAAVVVLTGDADDRRGTAAVAAGAQDYLVKGSADGAVLMRALRYAMERRAHERSRRELEAARGIESENRRLQRGLLPAPVISRTDVRVSAAFRPGQRRRLLGGDFLDAVEGPDGVVRAMIGDVSGHGPDEAALAARLRIAWRALVLARTPGDELCATLDRILGLEREDPSMFLTMGLVDIGADGTSATVRLAGHPPPVLLSGGQAEVLADCPHGPALGLDVPRPQWPAVTVALEGDWRLVLYTDGLYEGRTADGRWIGIEGLTTIMSAWSAGPAQLGGLLDAAEAHHDGGLTDDAALLMLRAENGP